MLNTPLNYLDPASACLLSYIHGYICFVRKHSACKGANTRGRIWLPPVGDSAEVHPVTLLFPLRDAAADSFILSAAGGCSLSPQHDSEAWLPIEPNAADAQLQFTHFKLRNEARVISSRRDFCENQKCAKLNKRTRA